ncbi:MAG: amidohydrolase family protein, partial [Myxococcota bacterium]
GTDATTTTDSTTSPDTDTVEPPPSCEDPIPAAPEGQVCGVVPGSDAALLIRADLVLPEGIQEQGQVLVENGMITCVGCDCASKPAAATATVFNCPEGVVSPGLINAHDHITYDQGKPIDIGTTRYDHRNEWRNGMNGKPEIPYDTNPDPGGTAWSEMRQVMAGTTSIFASGGSFGMLRNLDVANKLEGLTHGTADYDVFPLGSSGIYNSGCDKYSLPAATIADGKVAYVPHVSEGVSVGARNEFICLDGQQDGGVDIVGENVGFIHGVGTTAADIGIFVGENAKLVWSPRSNTVLYGFTAYAPIYHKMGGQVALGTDWTFSGSATILRELRCAQDWNERWDNYFSDQQLVNMVTSWAASALGFGDVLGSLTVNKVADIAIWDARVHTGYRAILDATDGDVVLAMRGGPPPSIGGTTYYRRGRPLIGEPALVAELSDRQLNYASYDPAIYSATDNSKKKLPPPCEDVTVCGKTKSFCVAEQLETKPSGSSFFTTQTLAELRATLNASYTLDLFVCDAPADEPTCVPFRPGEFDGTTSANDPDGDNLVGVDDNCPDWFNAIRPMDGGKQPDTDGDGLGDVCDPCPLQANTTACESVNPDDIDGDSVLNDSDNCPSDANPGQEDRDHDNIGDLCDACPDDSNEGGKACPSTISQVKQDAALKGSDVFLPGVMCVSAGKDFFTVQTKGATTPDFNGLYVFAGASGLKCTPGDTIDLQGHIEDFHGQTEMTSPTFVTTAGTTNGPVPDPFVVNAADIGATGTKIFEYEALLVTVQNVSVTSITPTPATGETVSGEFVVTGGLSVDDQIFLITPFPAVGDAFPAITGVTRYTWNRIKLLPRSVDDYSSGPPALAAIEPATGSMYAGDVGGPFQVRLTGKAQGAT